MGRYASNQEVTHFFARHGIPVTNVRREGTLRKLRVHGEALVLPMDASPEECLRIVRESMGPGCGNHPEAESPA